MWIGDFVRGHTVVRVLKQRWPNRPVDLLVTSLCAPLVDYMPGVRSGIVWDLPRGRLAVAKQAAWRPELRAKGYGTALVLPRTWKAAIAPALAGIPERVGFFGEARFGLINRMRWDEKSKRLPRFIDKNAALALPAGAKLPPEWPVPQLRVAPEEAARWRQANGLGTGPRWRWDPARSASPSAGPITRKPRGCWPSAVSTSGWSAAPAKRRWRRKSSPPAAAVRDLTGTDLRNGVLAMAAAGVAITNDSGLMHIAAAIGTPTMGIFGPTSPYLWAPLNGLAATVLTKTELSCQPCQRTVCTMNDHRCMRDIAATEVADIAQRVLQEAAQR